MQLGATMQWCLPHRLPPNNIQIKTCMVCHVFVLCFILDPPATPPPQLSAAAIAIAGAISGTIFVLAVLFVLITCVSVNKSTNVIAFGGFQRSYTG